MLRKVWWEKKQILLWILTRHWVLGTVYPGRNNLLGHFNIFIGHKPEKTSKTGLILFWFEWCFCRDCWKPPFCHHHWSKYATANSWLFWYNGRQYDSLNQHPILQLVNNCSSSRYHPPHFLLIFPKYILQKLFNLFSGILFANLSPGLRFTNLYYHSFLY